MLIKLSNWIDSLNQTLGKTIAYGTLLMALITFAVVVLRYGFNLGWIAMQESVTYLHAAVFLLGAAFTYQQGGHVRVDVFYRKFSQRQQHWVDLLGSLIFLLPVSVYISYICFGYVWESWQLFEGSREPGGLPFVYVLKSFLLIFSFSMLLQALSEIIKHSTILFSSSNSRKQRED